MEVTRYYCQTCGSEVRYEDWTRVEIAIDFKSTHNKYGEKLYLMQKVCDDCLSELGFPATLNTKEIKSLKWELEGTKGKFMEVAKKILGWKEKKNVL